MVAKSPHVFLVAYDVSNDRRRARLAKKLDRLGQRLQRSVFLVEASSRDPQILLDPLASEIDPRADRLDVIPMCPRCMGGAVGYGDGVRL